MAQRIRHLTTNQGIVGSNPTGDVLFFFVHYDLIISDKIYIIPPKKEVLPGLKPGSLDSESRVITITL